MTPADEKPHDGSGEPPDRTHDHENEEHDHSQHTGQAGDDVAPSIDQGDVAQFSVPEMDCPSCAGKVENSIGKLDGIDSVDPQVTTGTLTVSYDGEHTSATSIADRVEKAGYTVENTGEVTSKFTVPEMDCASRAGKIENALDRVSGVTTYETQATTGTVVVTCDSSRAGLRSG
jgi:Cd2+/Zn2+-exporting ATPase